MRDWISRRRLALTTGSLLVVATVVGVLWGLADVEGATANEATPSTTSGGFETSIRADDEVSTPTIAASTTTTSETSVPITRSTTTTLRRGPTTGPSGGGAETTTSAVPNLAPSIDDLGVTSEGLTLNIEPVVSDTDGDDLLVTYTLDGVEVFAGSEATPHTVSLDFDDVGYTHTAVVAVTVDDGFQTVTDFVEHELAAITSVEIDEISYEMRVPDACFESSAAERLSGVFGFSAPIGTSSSFSVELRPDRPDVVLVDGLKGEIAGEPPRQVVEVNQLALAGDNGSPVRREFTETDSAIASLFSNACRGTLIFRVEMATR